MFDQFQKEFIRCCPDAKDFMVHWEDVAPVIVEWARRKPNPVASLMVDELYKHGAPSQGIHIFNECEEVCVMDLNRDLIKFKVHQVTISKRAGRVH